MRFTLPLFALTATALAAPTTTTTASPLQQMHTEFAASDLCKLPDPGNNCAGATMQDIIIQYPHNVTKEQADLVLNAAKESGAKLAHEFPGIGFSGFIPDKIVSLIKAHGQTFGLVVHENACAEIPWCGEAPC